MLFSTRLFPLGLRLKSKFLRALDNVLKVQPHSSHSLYPSCTGSFFLSSNMPFSLTSRFLSQLFPLPGALHILSLTRSLLPCFRSLLLFRSPCFSIVSRMSDSFYINPLFSFIIISCLLSTSSHRVHKGFIPKTLPRA